MVRRYLVCLCLVSVVSRAEIASPPSPPAGAGATPSPAPAEARAAPEPEEDPPEGYYAFVESPNATPPRVRPPPYRQVSSECSEADDPRPHVTANNLCGDLNRGIIPKNPMGHSLNGEPYPFELVRNLTLRFLSRTLPVLRADDTLPRVKHIAQPPTTYDSFTDNNRLSARHRRAAGAGQGQVHGERQGQTLVPSSELVMEHRAEEGRESRKFCDNGGVFCMLYRAINGESTPSGGGGGAASVERREDPGSVPAPHLPAAPRYEGPPTPCPARVEYATPVFARNYQGVWRYVVQIPYEGYFTQTVEVTRCMQSRCHYLDGGCLSSPRWVSLLVAELHYPPAAAPAPTPPAAAAALVHPQINDFQEYHQYLQKRAGEAAGAVDYPGSGTGSAGSTGSVGASTDKPQHCDGHDEQGCFQVRLYYDWFLVPGSCKCWRPDYFARYVRRRHSSTEL